MLENLSNGPRPDVDCADPPRDVVLIIDDDAAVLASLKFALELEGFAVEVFRSAEEMLERPPPPASLPRGRLSAPGDGRRRARIHAPVPRRRDPGDSDHHQPAADRSPARDRGGLAIVEKPLLGNTLGEAIRSALKT